MTREEAIKKLRSKRDEVCNDCLHAVGWCESHCEFSEVINMAIEALRQPASSNTIDRQATIDALNEYFARIGKLERSGLTEGEKAISLDTVGIIKTLPSAQSKRKKGEWIPHKSVFGGLGEKVYTCNQCGYNIGFHAENYCSNCGADMRGERDEID